MGVEAGISLEGGGSGTGFYTMDFSFGLIEASDDFWVFKLGTYDRATTFLFAGSDKAGTLSAVKGIGRTKNAAESGDFRIYDVTNSQVICELTSAVTGQTEQTFDLGTISNVPTGEAVWEIQGREAAGTTDVYLMSMQFRFNE